MNEEMKQNLTEEEEALILDAWRDSESYAVPMTEIGERLAQQRYFGFREGWKYSLFYQQHNHICKKDYDENGGVEE